MTPMEEVIAMSGSLKRAVEYHFRDLRMNGSFSVSTEGPPKRPCVLIVHDAFGLDSHCIDVADRLATQGFAARALDLWGDRRQFTNSEEVMGMITDLLNDRELWMGR